MLLTKLHIPTATKQNLVQRPLLFDKLSKSLKAKLTLVSAPAGFGKSTIVSEWIHEKKIPAAWYSIDNNDNDVVEFLNYIILSIQNVQKDIGQHAIELLKSPNPPSVESIVKLLINDITNINNNFVLVLDDFHLITKTEISDLIIYLLEYCPQNIHLIIITRSDPKLPIAKLRSQQQLVEFRSSDLSFTANDIAVLFNKKFNFKLTIDDIQSLETKTEGWIAGLQLAALSMQGYEDTSTFIQAFAGNNRYIMDYLIEEVLQIQSEETKEFLLKTSILKQISAPLCNRLLDRNDSQEILEKLEKENMFVFPLDNERYWYRYHHLFADLLKQRLVIHDKLIVEDLHNKAADWFEENNMYDLAINHTMLNKNFERSLQLLDQEIENMWRNGHHDAIINYGNILPSNIVQKHPVFSLYFSWILISEGNIQKAEPLLISAEKVVKETISEKNITEEENHFNNKLLGKISVAFAFLNSHKEYTEEIFEYCKRAMDNLTEEDPFWYSWAWFSYGIAYFSSGNLKEGQKAFSNAFEYGKRTENVFLMSTIAIRMAENEQQLGQYKSAYKKCSDLLNLLNTKGYSEITKVDWRYAPLYLIMGSTEFVWAEMDKAYENIKIAYALSKNAKDIFFKTIILMIYSYVLNEKGDKEAINLMKELDDLMRNNAPPPYLTSMHIGWKIYLTMRKNDIEKAKEIAIENGLNVDGEITHTNETAYVALTRLLIVNHELEDANKILKKLDKVISSGERIERLIDVKVLYAAMHKALNNKKEVINYLIEAMELASEENLISYFVFNVDQINEFIEEIFSIHATTKTNISDEFISNLKIAIEKSKKFWETNIVTELSSREIDTLKLIAKNLTNHEIANKLFISQNTVKTHLKNINLKLEVNSRTKAVEKAKELGII
jgi:ATP/maltotriose-dependent transcriptional regulator MalT